MGFDNPKYVEVVLPVAVTNLVRILPHPTGIARSGTPCQGSHGCAPRNIDAIVVGFRLKGNGDMNGAGARVSIGRGWRTRTGKVALSIGAEAGIPGTNGIPHCSRLGDAVVESPIVAWTA